MIPKVMTKGAPGEALECTRGAIHPISKDNEEVPSTKVPKNSLLKQSGLCQRTVLLTIGTNDM